MGSSGETTQPGTCLPCKHESEFDLQNTHESNWGTVSPVLEKLRQAAQEIFSKPALNTRQVPASKRPYLQSKTNGEYVMNDSQGQGSPLAFRAMALSSHIVVGINMTNKTKQITTYKHELWSLPLQGIWYPWPLKWPDLQTEWTSMLQSLPAMTIRPLAWLPLCREDAVKLYIFLSTHTPQEAVQDKDLPTFWWESQKSLEIQLYIKDLSC